MIPYNFIQETENITNQITHSQDLITVKNPSALVSLQLCNKEKKNLIGIEKFKNLAELDISGNYLINHVPELASLKFLKKLNLSNNQITEVWPIPSQCENLSLSYNKITHLNSVFQSLIKLHTLDISNNLLTSIQGLCSLEALKCLYANNNKISTVKGVEMFKQLLELDLSNNNLKTREDISSLNFNSNIVVISIEENPVLQEFQGSRGGFAFESIDEFPRDYTEIKVGLYFRNPEGLRKLKSSRYRGIIKHYKNQENYSSQIASPDWGCSKNYASNRENIEDSLIGSYDDQDLQNTCENPHVSSLSIQQSEEIFTNLIHEINEHTEIDEELQSKKPISIAKLDLEKISGKVSREKSSTKPESNLESLFDELITYCHIEEYQEKEFSFSNEKYEHAVSVLKTREDERKNTMELEGGIKEKIRKLEKKLSESRGKRKELEKLVEDIREENDRKDKILQEMIENERKKNIIDQKKMTDAFVQTVELLEDRQQNIEYSFESGLSSYSQLPELSLLGENPRFLGGDAYLVDKNVGNYIQKLLKKISSLVRKKKSLREKIKRLEKIVAELNLQRLNANSSNK
ncbi:hypothetical protein SteCoe_6489 [Stentor coeruleus]|uniref:Uncharacterized protein n=1 Tax=Stentor coeruleus TaxID=5963 RepID=A0A1R2CPU3_9CILI|nr:hypothetical protein SteCoe_6489 [Stentor coeruleus]